MLLRLLKQAVVGVLVVCPVGSVFAQRQTFTPSNTPTYGQAARILTAPTMPAPTPFVNPTYRSSGYDQGWRNTIPSTLIPTAGVYRPMPGAGGSSDSLGVDVPDDDPTMRPVIPANRQAPPSVVRLRPGDDLLDMAPAAAATATVVVKVPANAEVWFDGNSTRATGAERAFETPQLPTRRSYHYDVKARWLDDGKAIEKIRTVTIRPGERSVVDFEAPASK